LNVVLKRHSQRRLTVRAICGAWCYATRFYGEQVDGQITGQADVFVAEPSDELCANLPTTLDSKTYAEPAHAFLGGQLRPYFVGVLLGVSNSSTATANGCIQHRACDIFKLIGTSLIIAFNFAMPSAGEGEATIGRQKRLLRRKRREDAPL
jgi:hypothetical protein